jgi:hypothetical protein
MNEASRSLSARVERLERQNRRQRWLLLGLPAVALLLGASAAQVADWKGKSVTTEKLILVDGDGKERGALYVHKGEPVLELYNKDHSLLLNAGKSPDNGVAFIQFFDEKGKFKGGVGGNALK